MRTLCKFLIFSLMVFLLSSTSVRSQYHYFETNFTGGMLGKSSLDFILSGQFNYGFHVSPHHCFGAQLAFNRMPLYEHYGFYYTSPNYYTVRPRYYNYPFGTAALFYRTYLGEFFFTEVVAGAGRFHERFTATRKAVPGANPPVSAVTYASNLRWPVFKFEGNFGAQFTVSDHLILYYKTGCSVYVLNPPMDTYIRVSSSKSNFFTFKPTSGAFAFMQMSLGIGLRR